MHFLHSHPVDTAHTDHDTLDRGPSLGGEGGWR